MDEIAPIVGQPERKVIPYLLASTAFVVILLVGGGYYVYENYFAAPRYNSSDATPVKVLLRVNSAFAEADALMRDRKFKEAEAAYTRALALAQDKTQESQIRFKIASAILQEGDLVRAVQSFQDLGADEQAPHLMRAYAVQSLGMMYWTYQLAHPEVATAIFSRSPYKEFLVGNDYFHALRKLFAYASNQYPLGVTEARIAESFAIELQLLSAQHKLTEDVKNKDMAIIQRKFANIDKDIARTTNDPNASGLNPAALLRKAEVLRRLNAISLASADDADKAYRAAITLYSLAGAPRGEDSFARFSYAEFLVGLPGEPRTAALKKDLVTFVAGHDTVSPAFVDFARANRTRNKNNEERMAMVKIANLVPEFKSFLTSVGWTAADFSRK